MAHHVKVLSYPAENKVNIEVNPLPSLTTDRVAVDQIFGNLLSNAVKFLKPGSEGLIKITTEQDEERTTIHIQDNGRGISHEAQLLVFEIFQRGDSHRDVPGEGMGLTYTKTLVQRLGGRITVKSTLDEGSVFTFYLPNTPPPQEISGNQND